jgi:uncharacterized protein YejL (UPF0352 family)
MLVVWGTMGALCGLLPLPVFSASEPLLPLAYRFTAAERTTYHLDYRSESKADISPLFQDGRAGGRLPEFSGSPTTTVTLTMQGEWDSSVVKDQGDTILLACTLTEPRVKFLFNGEEAADDAHRIEADLQREHFVTVNRQGRVLSLRFDPEISELSKGVARAIAGLAQFVLPSPDISRTDRWESLEDIQSGQLSARYERIRNGTQKMDEVTLRKIPQRVLVLKAKPRPGDIPVRQTITPSGETTATIDLKRGHLASLSASMVEVTAIGGKTIARTETTLSLAGIKRNSLDAQSLAHLRDTYAALTKVTQPTSLIAQPSAEVSEARIQRNELKDATADSLLRELAQAEASPDSANETSLYLRLKALVYLHPETSARLGAVLKTAKANSLSMQMLAGVLGDVGHREAERALIVACQARKDDPAALIQLVSALGAVAVPSREAELLVQDVAAHSDLPELKLTAELTLGNMARNLADTEPKRARAIASNFTRAITSARDEERKEQLLLAIGNAGTSSTLPTLSKFLSSSSPRLRATAAFALRFVNDPRADAWLANTLTSDTDGHVRSEAANALSFREATNETFQSQEKALLGDQNMTVRLTVLRNLWNARDDFPEVKELIRTAASKDPAADVRKAARELISQYPEKSPDLTSPKIEPIAWRSRQMDVLAEPGH